jgi:hypothetical protein
MHVQPEAAFLAVRPAQVSQKCGTENPLCYGSGLREDEFPLPSNQRSPQRAKRIHYRRQPQGS